MSDNKERHLCFAHVGARLDASKFKALHVARASGTQVAGGVQYTRLTLQRSQGRRAAQLEGVVAAYNRAAELPVAPVAVPPHADLVLAFSTTDPHSNAIVARIEADREGGGPGYWEWPAASSRSTLWLATMIRKDLGLEGVSDEDVHTAEVSGGGSVSNHSL
jgi:hypothetical protein